jgi:hypothetical protein
MEMFLSAIYQHCFHATSVDVAGVTDEPQLWKSSFVNSAASSLTQWSFPCSFNLLLDFDHYFFLVPWRINGKMRWDFEV